MILFRKEWKILIYILLCLLDREFWWLKNDVQSKQISNKIIIHLQVIIKFSMDLYIYKYDTAKMADHSDIFIWEIHKQSSIYKLFYHL